MNTTFTLNEWVHETERIVNRWHDAAMAGHILTPEQFERWQRERAQQQKKAE